MSIENQFVKNWRNTHSCRVVSHREAQQLFDYLNTLPWETSRIDWGETPGIHVPFGDDDPQEQWVDKFHDTPLGRHDFIMVAYAPGKEAILAARDDVLADLDILYAGAPGVRYFCGADIIRDTVIVAAEDFAEFSDNGVIVRLAEHR
jgi:hypothetical protein